MEEQDHEMKCRRCSEVHLRCHRCGATNVVGPFTMDGNVSGEYRTDAVWIVCRECNGSTFLGFEGTRVA